MKNCSIYIVKNLINDKVYIGQTTCVERRWQDHKCNALSRNRNSKFYNAIRKYGIENFYIETLETNIPSEDIERIETEYIKKFDSVEKGYNSKYREKRLSRVKDYNVEDLIKMYEEGLSLKAIGKKYGSDKKEIGALLREHGVQIRDWNKLQSNPIVTKEFLEDEINTKRKSVKQISKEVNLSDTAIRNWMKKFNISIRNATL